MQFELGTLVSSTNGGCKSFIIPSLQVAILQPNGSQKAIGTVSTGLAMTLLSIPHDLDEQKIAQQRFIMEQDRVSGRIKHMYSTDRTKASDKLDDPLMTSNGAIRPAFSLSQYEAGDSDSSDEDSDWSTDLDYGGVTYTPGAHNRGFQSPSGAGEKRRRFSSEEMDSSAPGSSVTSRGIDSKAHPDISPQSLFKPSDLGSRHNRFRDERKLSDVALKSGSPLTLTPGAHFRNGSIVGLQLHSTQVDCDLAAATTMSAMISDFKRNVSTVTRYVVACNS